MLLRLLGILALLLLNERAVAETPSERYSVGSWEIISEDGFCKAKLDTWMYEIDVTFLEGVIYVSLGFDLLSFTSKEVWGYTGEVEFFTVSNEMGSSILIPFSDYLSYGTLELVGRRGELEPSFKDAESFMRIIAGGSQVQIFRTVTSSLGKVDDLLLSVTQEGGAAAMQVIEHCT